MTPRCPACGQPIVRGQNYIYVNGKAVHKDCYGKGRPEHLESMECKDLRGSIEKMVEDRPGIYRGEVLLVLAPYLRMSMNEVDAEIDRMADEGVLEVVSE